MLIKVGFIGAGSMAKEHIKAFSSFPEVRTVGIFSRTRSKSEKLSEEYNIDFVCDSVDELWNMAQPDLVVVAVNESGVLDIARDAGKFPWKILFEKPAGHTLELATEVRRFAEKNGKTAHVALNRRFNSSTRTALSRLREDDSPRFIQVADQQDLRAAEAYGHPREVVDNFMFANSIHVIDLIRFFGRGHIDEVIVDRPWDRDRTFIQGASIHFSSGDFARYDAVWQGPGPWSCSVTTRQRRLEMRPLETLSEQVSGSRQTNSIQLSSDDIEYKAGFKEQAKAAIGLFHGGTDLPSLADGLETMKLINAIYR